MEEVEIEKTEESSGENWTRCVCVRVRVRAMCMCDVLVPLTLFPNRMMYLLTDNPDTERLASLLYRWAKVYAAVLSTSSLLTSSFV